MRTFNAFTISSCFLILSNIISAIPTAHDKRNSESDPKDLQVNIEDWRDIAEEDCYLMLCRHHGKRVWQRSNSPAENDRHRTASGAKQEPFHANELGRRGTQQINSETVSAEEFPWASMARDPNRRDDEPDNNAALFPATLAQQGGKLKLTPHLLFLKVLTQD
ncbi:hypothetical protein DM02DRAFT_664548 [Periconia macrospinosa]|uniref:Uncharacterized protein n=1 Tax=Periconia macrospinosa TaxID=97972 RepID=A0A2V1CYV1_9PLEO|nr:hypothetical protein DM02DRAFT_664548 [Periconia macrospinosa]